MSAGFRHEARETVRGIEAGLWVVPRGVSGPFTSQSTMSGDVAGQIAGRGQAEPLVTFGHVAGPPDGDDTNVTVIGHSIGALGDPVWGGGAVSLPRGRAVVDERLGVIQGETVTLGGRRLRVAGVVRDRTAFGDQPVVFVRRLGAQTILRGRAEPTELATPIGEQAQAQAVPVGTNQRPRHG